MHIRERCDYMLLATNKILVAAVVRIEEDKVIQLVQRGLDHGVDPNVIMAEMRTGLEIVHEWYNKGHYFLADLIIVAELFSKVKNMVQEQNVLLSAANIVDVVFGTVKHDIHDIGKNMAISVMQSAGLHVIDMGVNVEPERFVEAVGNTGARILCLTCLLTSSYQHMKTTVAKLEEKGLRNKTTVIIGGLADDSVHKYVGSDYWVRDMHNASELCKSILSAKLCRNWNIS